LMQINKNADGTDSKKLEKAILEVWEDLSKQVGTIYSMHFGKNDWVQLHINFQTMSENFQKVRWMIILQFYVSLKHFPIIWVCHHCRWWAAQYGSTMFGPQGL
jgi:hypothetical protein